MTFACNVKKELCAVENQNECCTKAELYGLLLFGRLFSQTGFMLHTEHLEVVQSAIGQLAQFSNIMPIVKTVRRGYSQRFECLIVDKSNGAQKLFEKFGHSGRSVSLRINRANIENECCNAAFLRGVFLVCGSVVDPGKDYHLEFVSPRIKLGHDLAAFLEELGLEPKTVVRKGNFVVYFKDSEQIEDVLTLMGAVRNSLELMNIKAYKDLRNKVNRVTNCETANIGKTVEAASTQIEAINKVLAIKGNGFLSEELREIAKIRLDNPDLSLSELAKLANISRSGVNHRLRRIIEIANKLNSSFTNDKE